MNERQSSERMSQGAVARKPKNKENYNKNKTFEFPQGYLKTIISNHSNDFQTDNTSRQNKFDSSVTRKHNRSSSKKKRAIKRPDRR